MSKHQLQSTDGVQLPRRIEPEEETLFERLTTNAYENILPARYLRKDEDGNLVEQPEELFERVAKNISVAEAVHTDEEVFISPGHIKPEHPRREDLISRVFDAEHERVELTEDRAKYISYDSIIDDLPTDTKEAVKETKEEFQSMMERLQFMPNSPTLMNAGDELQQLSACFVDSPSDDMEDIHDTAKEASLIFQSGGGMGYGFWKLRPKGDTVGSTGGVASGPITFMETYDQMCKTVAQGGTRRGAQMGIMRVSHPDVIEFIHAKNKDVSLAHTLMLNDPKDATNNSFREALEEARELIDDEGRVPKHLRNAVEGHLSNFNISVGITEDFMEALENDEEYTFTNPRTEEPHVATEETAQLYETFGLGEYVEPGEILSVPAQKIWDRIIGGAHENGEPGVVFLERANNRHSFDVDEHPEHRIYATNPCGEQPLEEYEACNLGHINLSTIVAENAPDWRDWKRGYAAENWTDSDISNFLEEAIDWEELNRRVDKGTQFLDNVVTMSDFPIPEIEKKVRNMRKIGLGVMGLAQLYVQLGVKYGTPEANQIASEIMTSINHRSKQRSRELAESRGVFGEWDKSKYSSPIDYSSWFGKQTGEDAYEWEEGYPIRNHNTTTIAPTGTTSMIANTSGGCEPIYSVAYFKNVSQDVQGDEMLVEFDDYFLEVLEANGLDVEEVKEEAVTQMNNNEFDGVEGLSLVPDEIGELFVTTDELSARQHAEVQCACQKGVDSAISKTINAPNEATLEDTDEAFRYVYRNGGKGVTYYRDGTRSKQVVTTRANNKESSDGEPNVGDVLRQMADAIDKANGSVKDMMDELDDVDDDGEGGCPDCGSELEISEGCEKCTSCSYSACEI